MIRTTILILLTTVSIAAQDTTFVRDYCNKLSRLSDTTNIESQILRIDDVSKKYLEQNPIIGDNPHQEVLRFQYKLTRELMRNCPIYTSAVIRLIPKLVLDLENKLTKNQIDSLSALAAQIIRDKNIYLYIVSIDDFYPDSTITDYANRYREFWAPLPNPQKRVVLIVFSTTQRQIRISTGDISMTYLTDAECAEVNKVIIPHFKNNHYFEGLVEGLFAIKRRL